MGDAFAARLASRGLPAWGRFEAVRREVDCRQGRPDFLSVRKRTAAARAVRWPAEPLGLVASALLMQLRSGLTHDAAQLVAALAFSRASVQRALAHLRRIGLVAADGDAYRLGVDAAALEAELWAFELKLHSPKRAVFQAQQARSYAAVSVIVVPPDRAAGYERHEMALARWGIGLGVFDPHTGGFTFVRRPERHAPTSRLDHVYALTRLLAAA